LHPTLTCECSSNWWSVESRSIESRSICYMYVQLRSRTGCSTKAHREWIGLPVSSTAPLSPPPCLLQQTQHAHANTHTRMTHTRKHTLVDEQRKYFELNHFPNAVDVMKAQTYWITRSKLKHYFSLVPRRGALRSWRPPVWAVILPAAKTMRGWVWRPPFKTWKPQICWRTP
jgi:hypothetical protein